MIETCYRLTFNTPAFLGNADQVAQWRTPPIKALLRQWWRVAYAAEQTRGVDVAAMRQAEGRLFGVAADSAGDSRKSQLRMRLSHWDEGSLRDWSGLDAQRVPHEEVGKEGKPGMVGAQLYLGYGPLTFKSGTSLKSGAAIDVSGKSRATHADLKLAFPEGDEEQRLLKALAMADLFGTLGGRSRNGWGSLSLKPLGSTPALQTNLPDGVTQAWQQALTLDWPHAIGRDARGPLIWTTGQRSEWREVMVDLARIKIAMRLKFRFPKERPDGLVHERHWLSYPVTGHDVSAWKSDSLRLPNSLRFKVRADANGKLRGVIFHMPCLPPPAFNPVRTQIERVWQQVHQTLDGDARLQRSLA
ncbi:MAG: hypothetical protein RL223_4692 [Pseudomonadota bacterium]|jgi:CRISPR-associated protein Cmr1